MTGGRTNRRGAVNDRRLGHVHGGASWAVRSSGADGREGVDLSDEGNHGGSGSEFTSVFCEQLDSCRQREQFALPLKAFNWKRIRSESKGRGLEHTLVKNERVDCRDSTSEESSELEHLHG
jgi:hypothetical protein